MAIELVGTSYFEIASGKLSARFSPAMGGRLLEFRVIDGPHLFVPAEPQRFLATNWPRAGAYPLVPYHNRLENAEIMLNGEKVRLTSHPASSPHTLHGPGHTKPWSLVSHEATRLTMKLDYDTDENWPWPFETVQDFRLEDSILILDLTLTNLSNRPMPVGLGWHPYFASSEPVSTDAGYFWPHRTDYLPVGTKTEVTDRRAIQNLPTQYLERWNSAQIVCANGYTAELTASEIFSFLVIHRGDPFHICVEPVTHVANAWNLSGDPSALGSRILAPGETLEGSIRICIKGYEHQL